MKDFNKTKKVIWFGKRGQKITGRKYNRRGKSHGKCGFATMCIFATFYKRKGHEIPLAHLIWHSVHCTSYISSRSLKLTATIENQRIRRKKFEYNSAAYIHKDFVYFIKLSQSKIPIIYFTINLSRYKEKINEILICILFRYKTWRRNRIIAKIFKISTKRNH